ncbi:hypothetical protein L3X07_05550 [Levilactobacillus brevis]|nr:hypothetical protein [Levilactobacillus brevis]
MTSNTPQKAVRFTILKNGHPIIALTETPKKVPGVAYMAIPGKELGGIMRLRQRLMHQTGRSI